MKAPIKEPRPIALALFLALGLWLGIYQVLLLRVERPCHAHGGRVINSADYPFFVCVSPRE